MTKWCGPIHIRILLMWCSCWRWKFNFMGKLLCHFNITKDSHSFWKSNVATTRQWQMIILKRKKFLWKMYLKSISVFQKTKRPIKDWVETVFSITILLDRCYGYFHSGRYVNNHSYHKVWQCRAIDLDIRYTHACIINIFALFVTDTNSFQILMVFIRNHYLMKVTCVAVISEWHKNTRDTLNILNKYQKFCQR